MKESTHKMMTKSDEELTRGLFEIGQEKGAKFQMDVVEKKMRDTWRGRSPRVTLADVILCEQKTKIEKWGEKAFPLSEKQCAAIVRELRKRYELAKIEEEEIKAENEKIAQS